MLCAVSGGTVIWSLFPDFTSTFALGTRSANFAQVMITGIAALGACVLLAARPTRWLIGTGVALGLATEAPNSVVYDLLVGHAFPPAGPGLWWNAVAGLALTIAAILVLVALARASSIRLGQKVPPGVVPKVIIAIAAISAIVLLVLVTSEDAVPGTSAGFTGRDAFPLVWSATMTLAVPAAAMIVLPRSFGLTLLAGGLANDVANASFYTSVSNSEFGILVVILFVLAVVLAFRRANGHTPTPPDRPAQPA